MATESAILLKQAISAPPAEVYYALTGELSWQTWYGEAAVVDPHPGGRLYAWRSPQDYGCGEFTALEPGQRVAWKWQGRGEPAVQVEVTLAAEGDGTLLSWQVTPTEAGPAWTAALEAIRGAWAQSLTNLQSVLETGLPPLRRPVLGLTGGAELTAEVAARLGVPVQQGFLCYDPIEGLGAHAAGLQRDDVIVSLGGQAITTMNSYAEAMNAHQAGDHVGVVYFRGAERRTTTLELSHQPAPSLPATTLALAEALRGVYDAIDVEVAGVLEGVSEDQAGRAPAPGEWSARYVLAHLIATERGGHFAAALMAQGIILDNFGSNVECLVRSTAESYATIAELLAELKRAEAQTVRLVAALPADFAAHRGSMAQLSLMLLYGLPGHTRMHLGQMRGALATAFHRPE